MFGLSFLIYLLSLLKCQWNNYCCSVTKSCLTLCDPMDCSTQGSPVLHHLLSLPSFMSIEPLMPSNHLILCHPLPLLPSVFPSISLSQWVSSSHQVLKHWSFSFSISPSNEYSRLISFRIDWFDFLAVQGTLKGLLQHHNSKASILRCLGFFMVGSVLTSVHDYWKKT